MLQYALNDAKSVILLFIVFIGLFQFLTEEEGEVFDTSEKSIYEFFDSLREKFSENREAVRQGPKNSDLNGTGMILIETSLRCWELMKFKLKDSYLKLNILF